MTGLGVLPRMLGVVPRLAEEAETDPTRKHDTNLVLSGDAMMRDSVTTSER